MSLLSYLSIDFISIFHINTINPNNSYEIYYILHFPLASRGTKGDSSKKVNFNIQLNFEPFVIPRPSGTPFKAGLSCIMRVKQLYTPAGKENNF